MKKIALILTLLILFLHAKSQVSYSINGVVKDASGETLPSATIFLDGSEKKTSTNDKGEFAIAGLSPGTYQLTVHFIGYKTWKRNVLVRDKSMTIDVEMAASEVSLNEVVITNKASKNKYLGLFIRNFLGETENGKACFIANPEILKFSEQGLYVTARTSGFLVIENPNLGYRIKYLLRDFRLNRMSQVASYTGECIFENLEGSDIEKQEWEENRRLAYDGSLMHFLRSLYSGTTDLQGFFFYPIKNARKEGQHIDTNNLTREDITSTTDSVFLNIKFPEPLYLVYDTLAGKNDVVGKDEARIKQAIKDNKGSTVELFLEKATIDAKGSTVDYRSFLIRGLWGTKRIGDQLPFEYLPD